CGGSACRWRVRCRCCRARVSSVSWPGWAAGGDWRRAGAPRPGTYGQERGARWPGWSRGGGGARGAGGGGGGGGGGSRGWGGRWGEVLAGVAVGWACGVGLVVEDVHWADSETLDFLTFLVRAGRRGPVQVVATCRGDEAPLAEHVAGWLARVRGDAGTEE